MPRGDKSSYTDKQKRQAENIEESYRERGVSEETAEHRAWATVNKQDGGGKKSGSGRAKARTSSASRKKSPATKATSSKSRARKTPARKSAKKRSTSKSRKSGA